MHLHQDFLSGHFQDQAVAVCGQKLVMQALGRMPQTMQPHKHTHTHTQTHTHTYIYLHQDLLDGKVQDQAVAVCGRQLVDQGTALRSGSELVEPCRGFSACSFHKHT